MIGFAMSEAPETAAPEPTFDGDEAGLREAANEIAGRRVAAIASIFSVADAVPNFNVATGCKAMVAINKQMDLSDAQTYQSCMSNEDSARMQLEKNWASYPPVVRERCVAETEQGDPSYVGVLTCIQIAQDPTSKAILQNK
jgi:hypothetical protein